MPTRQSGAIRSWVYYACIGVFCAAYAYLLVTQPVQVTSARFQLSSFNIALLRASIALLLSVIWFLGCYAAIAFHQYAYKVRESASERGYLFVSYGLWILLGNLVLSSLISLLRSRLQIEGVDVETLRRFFGILTTYSQIILYLAGFAFMYVGSKRLLGIVPQAPHALRQKSFGLLLCVLGIGIVYIIFIFQNPYRFRSDTIAVSPIYYVSDGLIVATIALPYIAMWFIGALATMIIYMFRQRVQGVIYRHMLNHFALGMLLVVISTILLQIVRQFPIFFASTTLGRILITLYGLIALIVCGYLLIASSAKRLLKIEDV